MLKVKIQRQFAQFFFLNTPDINYFKLKVLVLIKQKHTLDKYIQLDCCFEVAHKLILVFFRYFLQKSEISFIYPSLFAWGGPTLLTTFILISDLTSDKYHYELSPDIITCKHVCDLERKFFL